MTPTIEPKPGASPLPQAGVALRLPLVPTTATGLPRRLPRAGGGNKASLRGSCHRQLIEAPHCPALPQESGGLGHCFC